MADDFSDQGDRRSADQSPNVNLGRPLHPVWREFEITVPKWAHPGKQHPDVKCKYCPKVLHHAQPKKNMVPHLVRQCPNVPANVRAKFEPFLGKRVRDVSTDSVSPKWARGADSSRQRTVHEPVSASEKKEFHRAIAAAFYSAGISFRVIENPAMRFILTRYRAGMTLPTRQELAATLLDEAYSEEWENVKVVLAGQKIVAVVCDGWSDPNSESIVNFMVVSPFIRPIFWCSVPTRDDQHTGEYVAAALSKVIGEVEAVTGKGTVCAVVTDNASNMTKSWELLVEKNPALTCNGCAAHTLNLVLKDMFAIEYLAGVLKSAVAVTKFVRKRPALLYHFREVQRRKLGSRQRRRALVLPVSTRWYSSTNCISSIVRNEEVLREVFANDDLLQRYKPAEVKLNRVKTILADSSFWTKARAVLRLVDPVIKALGALEKDGCCLSMVYHYFRGLNQHRVFCTETDDVEDGVLKAIKTILEKRWKAMKRESVLAAYLLDPSKSPDDFEGDDLDKAVTACVDLAVRVGLRPGVTAKDIDAALLSLIRAKDGWSPQQWEEASRRTPLDWWRLKSGDFALLRDLATRVLSIPTSSAASERSWSVHAFIHNKRRNRLKPERVEKLAFLYTNAGDKMATSAVHYKEDTETNHSDVDSDSSTDFHLSDPDTAVESRRRRSNGRRRSVRGSDSAAARSLFSPAQADSSQSAHGSTPDRIHANDRSVTASLGARSSRSQRVLTELPLTQTTLSGTVFTRADEYQLHARENVVVAAAHGYVTPARTTYRSGSHSRGTRSQQRR